MITRDEFIVAACREISANDMRLCCFELEHVFEKRRTQQPSELPNHRESIIQRYRMYRAIFRDRTRALMPKTCR